MAARHAVRSAYSLERMANDYAALYASARRPDGDHEPPGRASASVNQ